MSGLPLIFNPNYHISGWHEDHRFPMPKYLLLHQLLLSEGIVSEEQFHEARPASRKTLERVHWTEYLDNFEKGSLDKVILRQIGLPWSRGLVKRAMASTGGTLLAGRLALEYGIAINLGGGTHHAYPGYGAGFCILNDVSVALRQLRAEGLINRALITDLDVHQGDGTAWIHREEPEIFTFSMHCGINFPFHKQIGDMDISLDEGIQDRGYLDLLKEHLPFLIKEHCPDLIFFNAGCDPHRDDPLGKLDLSSEGLFERDTNVFRTSRSSGIPVAGVLGGGYSRDHSEIAERHAIVVRAASQDFRQQP